jgi:endonuclease-3
MDFSQAGRAERADRIFQILDLEYPQAKPHLNFRNAFQLLVATILAAQCTDEMVNRVTPELFRRFPDPSSLAEARTAELEQLIRSTGFYRNKAKSLLNMARSVQDQFRGTLPRSVEELVRLPGVGRKTANVVAGNCYGQPSIIVDTHFKRVVGRLNLSDETNPDKIERSMWDLLPEEKRTRFSMVVNEHGRGICTARKPLCPNCSIADLCPFPGKSGS